MAIAVVMTRRNPRPAGALSSLTTRAGTHRPPNREWASSLSCTALESRLLKGVVSILIYLILWLGIALIVGLIVGPMLRSRSQGLGAAAAPETEPFNAPPPS